MSQAANRTGEGAAVLSEAEATALAARVKFPIQVSANGRHFVDRMGREVFWLGTTQWELFRGYRLEEAATILQRTAAHGMAFVQVMLLGVGDGTAANVYGETAWANNDPLTPNEAYFKYVDAVVRLAGEHHLAISMTMYHQLHRNRITLEKARAWGRWVGERYKEADNIVWSMTPQAKHEFVPVLRELAGGLRQGDGGRHLITFKPDPSPYSSSFLHGERWLDFNAMQTWKDVQLIYPMVSHDYGLGPAKPVLMGEGAYEAGTEYGFEVTPLWIRRQAYYSCLAGAHHTYGHNDSWRILPSWKSALDAPGARQMGLLRRIFLAREQWWKLVPDQTIFASGAQTAGQILRLAARHGQGRWAMIYLAETADFSIRMKCIQGAQAAGAWVNPATGEARPIGELSTSAVHDFSTPPGWEDAMLILEQAKSAG